MMLCYVFKYREILFSNYNALLSYYSKGINFPSISHRKSNFWATIGSLLSVGSCFTQCQVIIIQLPTKLLGTPADLSSETTLCCTLKLANSSHSGPPAQPSGIIRENEINGKQIRIYCRVPLIDCWLVTVSMCTWTITPGEEPTSSICLVLFTRYTKTYTSLNRYWWTVTPKLQHQMTWAVNSLEVARVATDYTLYKTVILDS